MVYDFIQKLLTILNETKIKESLKVTLSKDTKSHISDADSQDGEI